MPRRLTAPVYVKLSADLSLSFDKPSPASLHMRMARHWLGVLSPVCPIHRTSGADSWGAPPAPPPANHTLAQNNSPAGLGLSLWSLLVSEPADSFRSVSEAHAQGGRVLQSQLHLRHCWGARLSELAGLVDALNWPPVIGGAGYALPAQAARSAAS